MCNAFATSKTTWCYSAPVQVSRAYSTPTALTSAPILPKAGGVDQTEAQNAMLSAEILAALKEAAKAAVEAALQNGLDKKHTGVVQAAALNAAVECLAPGSSETLNLTDDDDQILSLCVHRPCER